MRRLLAVLLCLVLLTACGGIGQAPEEAMVQPVLFYYCTDLNDQTNTAAIRPEYRDLGEKSLLPEEVLKLYAQGPQEEGLVLPLPEGIELQDAALNDGVLMLQVKHVSTELSGVQRPLAVACITLTMTQLQGVEAVCIQEDGQPLPDGWSGPWTADHFQLTNTSTEEINEDKEGN